jgi:hypothetical protein
MFHLNISIVVPFPVTSSLFSFIFAYVVLFIKFTIVVPFVQIHICCSFSILQYLVVLF